MHRVGIVGFGFMGQMHFKAYRDVAGAKVTAIFDADRAIFERGATEGNIAGGELGSLENVAKFFDYDKFLSSDVDVIDVCTPTFLHRELTERALRSGRPVLCEKPMALTVADCKAMIRAAEQAGKLLMIAQCVRFWPGYDRILSAIRSGEYGRCLSATFRRIGGAPSWSGWFLDANRSGGGIVDCLVHDFDFSRAAFGLPKAIAARGTLDALGNGSGVSYSRSDLAYPEGPSCVTIEGGWVIGSTYPFSMTAFVQFEEATMAFGIEPGADLVIHRREGNREVPKLKEGQGYHWELRYFLECLDQKKAPDLCPPAESCDAIAMALAGRDSVVSGKPVQMA